MRLPFTCLECTFGENKLTVPPYPTFVELRDDGRYEFTCFQGHKTVTILQQQKFELLFEIGAYALIDGYYRESVASFTAALERFHEYCLKVLCKKRGINPDAFSTAWKQISNQSERQLGAFLFIWTSEFGAVPQLLSSHDSGFRNSVIHKGKIPTKEEALKYGNTVLALIRPKIVELRSVCDEQIVEVTFEHIRDCSNLGEKQLACGTMSMPTIISLTTQDTLTSLEEHLHHLKWWRDRWHNN
ncbi:hypothetical protein P0F10_003365 [Vibrio metschnikovii]|nr:hypothetical protein [Vibrio metschnikovii]EKO3667504.1 hypothetical protein [Vibrio metschnikovii]EKO3698599.1 hypothetical protein [Vibrio metschnikovii]